MTGDEGAPRGARVEARRLARRFGDHVALDDLSLSIERGEAFGLLGANGAGKTTFIRLITGYLVPSEGAVTVDGFSPTTNAAEVHARLGYVAETSRLYPELRVVGFLRFAAGLHGLRGSDRNDAVAQALTDFNLEDVARRLIGQLSKGYQQRVSLAQAFLHDPSLLIVDEPTSGLDPAQREEVRAVIANMRGRRTVILCTHDMEEARELTSRAAVLYRGRLVRAGETEAILGDGEVLDLFRGAPGLPLPGTPSPGLPSPGTPSEAAS